MPLRAYQTELFHRVRQAFATQRSVLAQLPTGTGKTHIFAQIAAAARDKDRHTWIIVPRNELLRQASDKLGEYQVDHGLIAAGEQESRAFSTHIVSKDTLIRRYDKIKRAPDFIIIDEAHIALDRYVEIADRYPNAKILGFTATPERLDGRGLSELYDVLIEGPPIKHFIERGYLTPFRYFCPPISGLDKVHRRGTEYNADELDALLERRKVYGDAVKHYERLTPGRPCLVYCRSIKSAEQAAHQFNAAGYQFENIDGQMSYKRRKALIDALRNGQIQGLTSCDLITYGLDVPRVEVIIMLRPTLSRALFFQMIGRGLRPYALKNHCTILDHVSNIGEHGHPLQAHAWQFDGREKRARRSKDERRLKLCPHLEFMYCERPTCSGCEHATEGRKLKPLEYVDGSLVEQKSPVKLDKPSAAEQTAYLDRVEEAIRTYKASAPTISPGPIGELLELADKLGFKPLWVYNRLNENKHIANIPLLSEIARQKKYKKGWVWFQRERLRARP
jgi:superfamily II DNA or RNA helicase